METFLNQQLSIYHLKWGLERFEQIHRYKATILIGSKMAKYYTYRRNDPWAGGHSLCIQRWALAGKHSRVQSFDLKTWRALGVQRLCACTDCPVPPAILYIYLVSCSCSNAQETILLFKCTPTSYVIVLLLVKSTPLLSFTLALELWRSYLNYLRCSLHKSAFCATIFTIECQLDGIKAALE